MNIAVCLKWVPDTKIRIALDQETSRPDPYDLIYAINAQDKYALTEGLSLRGRLMAQVTLVSLGPNHVRSMLLQALLSGADKAILIPSSEGKIQNHTEIAESLSMTLKSLDLALVLCGDESADEMRGEIGPMLAARLGFNLVTSVIRIENVDITKQLIRVKKSLGSGWVKVLECSIPAVLTFISKGAAVESFKDSEISFVDDISKELLSLESRISTYKPLPQSGTNSHDPIQGFELAKKSLKLSRRRPQMIPCPDPRLSASERIEFILGWGIQGKAGGVVLKGMPEDVAKELLKILGKRGYPTVDHF